MLHAPSTITEVVNVSRLVREGTVFAVPLGSDYALGVLARKSDGIGFGYFFGPRTDQVPTEPIGR